MNILITPLVTMLPTLGAFKRCMSIAESAVEAGHNVIFCLGERIYEDPYLNKCKIIRSKEPSPMALPYFLGKIIAKLISIFNPPLEKSGSLTSFDSILYLTGAIRYKYLKKDITLIKRIIEIHNIDIIYSEYRLSSNIAGRLKNIPVFTTYSKIGSSEWGINKKSSIDINKVLLRNNLPKVNGALDVLNWATNRVVPTHPLIEEVDESEGILYCGSLTSSKNILNENSKKYILVYFGTGTFSSKEIKSVCLNTFKDLEYKVIVSSESIKECTLDNVEFRNYVNFNDLLPESIVYINHGGQNSTLNGLLYEVPQIIFPSNFFERQFNAKNVVKNNCGILLTDDNFNKNSILESINYVINNQEMKKSITKLKESVLSLGGADEIIKKMEAVLK